MEKSYQDALQVRLSFGGIAMRFWQRAFYSVLLLFIFCFFLSIFLVSDFSYCTSLNSERERSFGEAHFIAASLEKEISEIHEIGGDISYRDYYVFNTYINYYQNRDIFLALWENDSNLVGNIPWDSLEKYGATLNTQTSTVKEYESKKYMIVVSIFQSGIDEYTLVYAHDLQSFTSEHTSLSRFLTVSGTIITVLLATGLYVILRRLSKPIENLDEATGRISTGDYSMRLPEQGKDELTALARHFNVMADVVESKINELQSTAEQKQRFIDNLAHELRTPLTTIRGYAEYLKNANISEDDRITSIDYIISESKRIEEMTNKLLDLALMRNDILKFSDINLPELFNSVSEKIRSRLLEKGLEVKTKCELKTIYGDAVLLECLLNNLLDNAIKASGNNSSIQLSAFTKDDQKIIEVKDFGKGMSQEHIKKLTEPFYRVDAARSRTEGGAGLGLSLCSQIAELHKAKLIFSSEKGNGTSVKVVFTTP